MYIHGSHISFRDCLMACAANKDLVAEFDRLSGSNLSMKGTPIDLAIDESTGRQAKEAKEFVKFVHEFVWLSCLSESD